MRPRAAAIVIGTAINLLLVSVPLLWVDVSADDYLSHPEIWGFYLLVSLFCTLEAYVSQQATPENSYRAIRVYLPYTIGVCILSIFWLSLYQGASHREFGMPLSILGALLAGSGIAVRIVSIQTLKRYFVSHIGLTKDHRLITTGIYSMVRHPSELGMLAICFGVAMLLSSIAGIILATFVLLPLTLYRISLEEKLLRSLFQSRHEIYSARTPILIPSLIRCRSNRVFSQ